MCWWTRRELPPSSSSFSLYFWVYQLKFLQIAWSLITLIDLVFSSGTQLYPMREQRWTPCTLSQLADEHRGAFSSWRGRSWTLDSIKDSSHLIWYGYFYEALHCGHKASDVMLLYPKEFSQWAAMFQDRPATQRAPPQLLRCVTHDPCRLPVWWLFSASLLHR